MEKPLLPRESGQFIAERSRDVFVEDEGVQKVVEMLYSLRHSDDLTASGWKKANPLAPEPTSDQGSVPRPSLTEYLSLYTVLCKSLERPSHVFIFCFKAAWRSCNVSEWF